MINRYQLLKYMGIVQWILRNTVIFCDKSGIFVTKSNKLIVISDEYIDLNNLLVKDILRSMGIKSNHVYCILTKEILFLPKEIIYPCWILGNKLPINSKQWIIYTSPLSEIYFNPKLKRNLWMQICNIKKK
ncbi:MAG: hypothetical protein ArsCj_2070 [Arsenophonus endosymbiont of Ceratovacuna japonica]